MLEDFPNKVRLVVEPFPSLDNTASLLAASTALAAHAQSRFWEFRQALFQHAGPVLPNDLRTIAEDLDMDIPRLFHDLRSTEVQRLLAHCINEALAHGVIGKPTVFINEKELPSANLKDLRRAVQHADRPF